jgi:hypothetical protein
MSKRNEDLGLGVPVTSRFNNSSQDYGTSYTSTVNPTNAVKTTGTSISMGVERARPKYAFESEGIEFWGSAHSNLDEVTFSNKDLIINAYGTAFVAKPFVRSGPNWLNLDGMAKSDPHQLLLDWKDFSPPPGSVNIDFWESIIEQSQQEGIKRIIVCCGAGLGRTGTALAAFLLASGEEEDPGVAIKMIRTLYNRSAIETKLQELYVWRLVTQEEEIPFSRIFQETRSDRVETNYSRTGQISIESDPEDDAAAWSDWTKTNLNRK